MVVEHRPCKIVLLSLVTPRGVTDLHIWWGINIEHARTAYHKTCETEYQQPYHRRFNSQTIYSYILQMEYSTSTPNERVWRITQLAKLSFNHLSVVLTADVFQFFIKSKTNWSGSRISPTSAVYIIDLRVSQRTPRTTTNRAEAQPKCLN